MKLAWTLVVVVFCFQAVVVQGAVNISEGATCKEVNGKRWLCMNVKYCPKANKNLKEWEVLQYQLCNPKGEEVIVCCDPEYKTPAVGEKTKEMCKIYTEAVFGNIPIVAPNITLVKYERYVRQTGGSRPSGSNGVDAAYSEFPHMALIGYGNAHQISWSCGGSLISDTYVLSAAHCSVSGNGKARWVRLGDHNFRSTEDEKRGISKSVEYEITKIINHPNYTTSSFYNDITLYKLNETVEFNPFIRPLCLHTEYDIPMGKYTATGWGIVEWGRRQSDILQKMEVLVNSSNECREAYKADIGPKLKDGIKDESMICAGDVYRGVDTCLGDSGGPLQVPHPQVYWMSVQFGITSFGGLCGGNRPGVYTRVSHFIPWIESVVWP